MRPSRRVFPGLTAVLPEARWLRAPRAALSDRRVEAPSGSRDTEFRFPDRSSAALSDLSESKLPGLAGSESAQRGPGGWGGGRRGRGRAAMCRQICAGKQRPCSRAGKQRPCSLQGVWAHWSIWHKQRPGAGRNSARAQGVLAHLMKSQG